MKGKIMEIRLIVREGRLKIMAKINAGSFGIREAYLPARETATLLPRCILAGSEKKLSRKFLGVLSPIVKRMTIGRDVNLWKKGDTNYFSFLSWEKIEFEEVEEVGV